MALPALDFDGETNYLVGWYFMPRFMTQNFLHFCPVVAKDMAHCRQPAGGSLLNYAMQDGLSHVHMPIIGSVLDTECFRYWVEVGVG
jgi:hypothetical protein